MHTSTSIIATILVCLAAWILPAAAAGVAAGGGAQGTAAASQQPTTTTAPSLVVVGSSTTVEWLPYTLSFKSPLTTWAFPTPSAGTVGLGTIAGTVGTVKAG